jgi:hypothetical protein
MRTETTPFLYFPLSANYFLLKELGKRRIPISDEMDVTTEADEVGRKEGPQQNIQGCQMVT